MIILAAGWNAKGYTPTMALTTDAYGYKINDAYYATVTSDGLYVPTSSTYWLTSPCAGSSDNIICTGVDYICGNGYYATSAVRPVVCLKSSIPAAVGTGDYDFSLIK